MTVWSHWWLIFVLLQPVLHKGDARYPAVKLEEYHDYETCAHQADRVFQFIYETYSGETPYTVQCLNTTETHAEGGRMKQLEQSEYLDELLGYWENEDLEDDEGGRA